MKIALLDLNHFTRGVHTNTAPLGLGLIARYLSAAVTQPLEIRMFKDAEKCLDAVKTWTPDVVGMAQYVWNSELNLHVAKLIKEKNGKCLVVAGGPNLELSTPRKEAYLKRHAHVDICVAYDGEIPFSGIIQRLLNGESAADLRRTPVAGTYALDPATGTLIEPAGKPPRLTTLDVFGTMYADGFLDGFLDDGFHPFVQTHRGCPFQCEFCHTSDAYYTKMLHLSPEIFRKEMEYLGKRFAGRQNVTLYMANTNMSMFKEDFAIAEIIRDTQKTYGWPRIINVNSGKDPDKLLEMLSIIDFQPGIALQTLTPHVLAAIKRKNIPFETFTSFQNEVMRRTGGTPTTELILCLPTETKASFLETLRKVMNSGVQNIVVYTLMNLKGTPLSSDKSAGENGFEIRHRVVPRQFSIINGEKVLDTEEVVVGTNTLSFQEYLELRGLCFVITVFFSSTELIPLKRLLLEYGLDVAEWVFAIHKRLSSYADLQSSYQMFMRETEEELHESREQLLEFFNDEENYRALCEGRYGDNLLRKYKCKALYESFLSATELAVSCARPLLAQRVGKEAADGMLDDISRFLAARDMKPIVVRSGKVDDDAVELHYRIPAWLEGDDKKKLEEFQGQMRYLLRYSPEQRERLNDIVNINKDFELSLQILYRDGSIRDFWPTWVAAT